MEHVLRVLQIYDLELRYVCIGITVENTVKFWSLHCMDDNSRCEFTLGFLNIFAVECGSESK